MGHHVNIAERRIGHDGEVSDIDEIGMGDTQCSKFKEQQGVQPREKMPISMKWAAIAATPPITTRKQRFFPTLSLRG